MTTEIDLPCADRGTDLRERPLPTSEPSGTIETPRRTTPAERSGCDARYYPDRTVRLAEAPEFQRTEGSR